MGRMNKAFGKFWLGVFVLLVLIWGRGILAGSDAPEASAEVQPNLAILAPTLTPTPGPTATAMPTRTPRPTATSDAWYSGGTLHQATLAEWQAATQRNRLATAADWVVRVYKPTPSDEATLGALAITVSLCVDEVADDPELAFMGASKAYEIAAACLTLMQQ